MYCSDDFIICRLARAFVPPPPPPTPAAARDLRDGMVFADCSELFEFLQSIHVTDAPHHEPEAAAPSANSQAPPLPPYSSPSRPCRRHEPYPSIKQLHARSKAARCRVADDYVPDILML